MPVFGVGSALCLYQALFHGTQGFSEAEQVRDSPLVVRSFLGGGLGGAASSEAQLLSQHQSRGHKARLSIESGLYYHPFFCSPWLPLLVSHTRATVHCQMLVKVPKGTCSGKLGLNEGPVICGEGQSRSQIRSPFPFFLFLGFWCFQGCSSAKMS